MSENENNALNSVVDKIEESLEERKCKSDRRDEDQDNIPQSIERRSGDDRRD